MMNAMEMKGELKHLDARNEVVHAFSDHAKTITQFGNYATTPLTEGLKQMATWARQTGVKSSTDFENIEITEKLPPSWKN